MPAIALIAIRTLNEDTRIWETLGKNFSADVVESDALADVPPGLLDDGVAVHVWEQTKTKSLRITRICKTVHCYARLRRVERLPYSSV